MKGEIVNFYNKFPLRLFISFHSITIFFFLNLAMTQCWRHFNKKSGMIPRKKSCEIPRRNLRRILTRNSWRIIRRNFWRILMNKSWKNSRRKKHEGFQKKGFPKVTQGFPQVFSEWFQEGAPGGYPAASTGWFLEQTPIGPLDGTLDGNAVRNP